MMLRRLDGPPPGALLVPGAPPAVDVKKEVYLAVANACTAASQDQVAFQRLLSFIISVV